MGWWDEKVWARRLALVQLWSMANGHPFGFLPGLVGAVVLLGGLGVLLVPVGPAETLAGTLTYVRPPVGRESPRRPIDRHWVSLDDGSYAAFDQPRKDIPCRAGSRVTVRRTPLLLLMTYNLVSCEKADRSLEDRR